MSDALAVVIGIDHYPDTMLGPLSGAVNDAEAFAEWLQTPAAGSLVYDKDDDDATEIHKVVTTDRNTGPLNSRPMVSDVETALEYVRAKAEARLTAWEEGNGDPYKRLYLFFAGHGIGPDVEQAALLMANAGQNRFGYYVQGRPFANWFLGRGAFEEILLFMDCCRDAYPFVANSGWRWEVPRDSGRKTNFCYGFATKWGKKARESDVGGKMQGYFSAALLEGLKGAAADAAGKITAEDLDAYTDARIPMLVKKAEEKTKKKLEVQTPEFAYPPRRPMLVVDYGPKAAKDLLTRVRITLTAAEAAAPLEVLDGNLETATLIDTSRAGNVWTFRIPFGAYQLKNTASGRKQDITAVGPEDVDVTF